MAASFASAESRKSPRSPGFSLIEILVALAILSLIMVIVLQMISETERTWKHSAGRTQGFQSGRIAFETVYRSVSEATLNTYYDYYASDRSRRTTLNSAGFVPVVYGRYSELHFISGKQLVTQPRPQITHSVFFQTPASYTATTASYGTMTSLLNGVGFYIDFTSDAADRPTFFSGLTKQPPASYRYRLMEFFQPTEELTVYGSTTGTAWFTTPLKATSPRTVLLAENIIACVICPHLPNELTPATPGTTLSTDYEYDSRVASTPWTAGAQPANMHQLPPLVRVVLIAVDEASMVKIQGTSTAQPDLGFNYSLVFQKPVNLTADIATVSDALTAKHINFRVFQTDVPVRSAQWSN